MLVLHIHSRPIHYLDLTILCDPVKFQRQCDSGPIMQFLINDFCPIRFIKIDNIPMNCAAWCTSVEPEISKGTAMSQVVLLLPA